MSSIRNSGSLIRKFVHGAISQTWKSRQLSLLNLGRGYREKLLNAKLPIPKFKPEWEEEYLYFTFKPAIFRIGCIIIAVVTIADFIKNVFFTKIGDGTGGGVLWVFSTQILAH